MGLRDPMGRDKRLSRKDTLHQRSHDPKRNDLVAQYA